MSNSKPAVPSVPHWSIEGHRAVTEGADVRLDLAQASAGIGSGDGDRLLGLDLGIDLPPVDCWTRGDDIIATWEPGDDRALRATGLWRQILGTGSRQRRGAPKGLSGVSAWELIASATTRHLHAESTLAVVTDVAADDVLTAAWEGDGKPVFTSGVAPHDDSRRGMVLVRRRGRGSVLVMLHPSDHQSVTVERRGARRRIGCWLFPTGVEKGVLLRSRVLAATGPAENDLAWSGALASWFAPLPPDLAT